MKRALLQTKFFLCLGLLIGNFIAMMTGHMKAEAFAVILMLILIYYEILKDDEDARIEE